MSPVVGLACFLSMPVGATVPGVYLSPWFILVALSALILLAGTIAWLSFIRLRRREESVSSRQAQLDHDDRDRTAELARLNDQLRRETDRRQHFEAELGRERRFMDTFLQSVPDAVYFKDEQSRFLRCSESMAHLFGRSSASELVGKTDFDFFTEEHARPAFEDEQKIMRAGTPIIGLPEKEVFPDGRIQWSLTSKMPLRDEQGRIVGTFGISKNMTELKLAEAELQQREILFRLIFEHAPVGVAWKRSDLGNVYHFNAAFRRILELPADQAPDSTVLASLTHADDLARLREMDRQIGSGVLDNYSLEQRFVLKDGRLVWGRLSDAVVRNPAGHIIQEITILEDVSERKRTEQELADTYKHLMDASRVAGMAEIATGVLHNVGNVLNSINVSVNILAECLPNSRVSSVGKLSRLLHEHAGDLGNFLSADPKGQRVLPYLDTLADHLVGEQQRWLSELNSLRQNVDHIKDIVSMQQSYAKVVGVVEMLSPVDLMEDALRMNAAALTRHDVEVVREFAPVPAVAVERHKVLQVLINLIRNAKYALDAGGRPDKRLLVRIESRGGHVQLEISDNGIGISSENLTRIFSHGFTTRKDGHGFGLHSSALVAKEMHGSLTVQSDGPGRGATFILELPPAEVAAGIPARAAAASPV